MGPGMFKGTGHAAGAPAEGLCEEVRAERAASVGEGVEDHDCVLFLVAVVGWILGVGVAGVGVGVFGVRGEVSRVEVQTPGEYRTLSAYDEATAITGRG